MSLSALLGTTELETISKFLRDNYVENAAEKKRREHAAKLDEFYEGGGDLEIERMVEIAFKDPVTQSLRKELIEWSKWNNVIGRVVREKATVYSEPPRRKVAAADDVYQAFLELVQMDDAMRELDRKLAYQEDALLGYRVRLTASGDREPVLDVISPASFWAIAHPRDRTLMVGLILDQRMPGAKDTDPSYRVWTDDETFVMNGKCEIFVESIEEWPLRRMPFVLATTRRPGSKPRILAMCPSADLLAAQCAVWLQNLLLLKESKSANRQTYASGDTSAAVMGQSPDTERETILPEGVSVTAVDRGMDLKQFRDNSNAIIEDAAANHGLPPSVLHQRDASSGAEIELRRIPIRELRKERIPVMRRIEAAIAKVIALVNGAREMLDPSGTVVAVAGDLQAFAFSVEGWSMDFGEVQQPLTAIEADQVFDERRRLGLTDNYEEEMRRNPDLKTFAEAKKVVDDRTKRQVDYVTSQKALMALNGSLGSALGESSAQQNGAQGGAVAAAGADTIKPSASTFRQ